MGLSNMDSYSLNISGQTKGPLYQHRTKLPINGPGFVITNKPALPSIKTYTGPFVHLTAHRNGNQIAASDSTGNIFTFDFKRKRFWRICHLGIFSCTSLAFTHTSNLIVGISDCSVTVWNANRRSRIASKLVHKNSIHYISINDSGTRAITSSIEEAILWDLTSGFNVLYMLPEDSSHYILKVFFLHVSDYIVCAFRTSLVCLWNLENLKLKTQFTCSEESPFWLKAVDGSNDGKIIVCGGRSDTVFIWEAETGNLSRKISFANKINYIHQMLLLSNRKETTSHQVLCLLDQSKKLHFYDLTSDQYVNHTMVDDNESIDLFLEFRDQLVVRTSDQLKFYNIASFFEEPLKYKPKAIAVTVSRFLKSKDKMKKEVKQKKKEISQSKDMVTKMKEILLESNEYPALYRSFIWAQLLCLPRNNEFTNYYNDVKLNFSLLRNNYNDLSKTLRRALARQLSMLVKWCPLLKEIEYLPELIFPFVQYLHKNIKMCFELLITLISNWCRYWFLYMPFPPYNILYAIENILIYIDRPLLHHFMMHKITSDVYVFHMLRSSFSNVFTENHWLQLWDHLFSNPPSFIIFVTVAYLITSRKVLLRCKTVNDIDAYYSQNEVLLENVLDKAYSLTQVVPECFNLDEIIGPFESLPKGGYPPFTNFSCLESNLQTLQRQRITEEELDYSFFQNLRATNLEELQNLSKMREQLLEESFKLKDVGELDKTDKKVKKVQNLFEKHLVSPAKYLTEASQKQNTMQKINDVLSLREKLLEDE